MAAADLARHLLALELGLLHDAHSRESLEALLHEDFEEVGPGGRSSSRDDVLHWLLEIKRPEERWDLRDFRVKELGADLLLTLYHAGRRGGSSTGSRRASLWQRAPDGRWRLRFHQATPCQR